MKCPDNILTEKAWDNWCLKNNYTNNGVTGWFPDHMGCLHYWENFKQPTPNDLRRQKHAEATPYDYYESEWYIAKPMHMLVKYFDPEMFKMLTQEDLKA